ncbi:MAG TPA: riboflavin synthase [bacterium]|nr:riboflavin synthase [bacterium]
MFTGIVEGTGVVRTAQPGRDALRLRVEVEGALAGIRVGESIAVSGTCLTVTRIADDAFEADVTGETLARTTLGQVQPGDLVNLERPVAVGGRLGGHIVQGHVDGVGRVLRLDRRGDAWWLEVEAPGPIARYVVQKGSIAIDGVSLTVVARQRDRFTVSLIPHTCAVTTLGRLKADGRVNLEVDILAKYVEQLLASYPPPAADGTTRTPAGRAEPEARPRRERR